MPLPTPRRGEGQDDFISRCMANPTTLRDFPDNSQRSGVCYSQWENRTDNMKLYKLKANTLAGYEIRYESRSGRQHIVAPVTMLVEGVHNGTAGPIFYPIEELQAFPGSWDGRPVTLGHPEFGNDIVSASSPEMMEKFALGVLFNTTFDPDRGLVSEIWIDVERARRMAPEILEMLTNGRPLEVSTGLWFEESGGPGIWNDEEFISTARDFRPDHLALLPGAVGACAIHDGCGVRANADCGCSKNSNAQEDIDMATMDNGLMTFIRSFMKSQETKADIVAGNMETFAVNKPGMLSTIRNLQTRLDALDRDMPNGALLHFLEDAFDDGTFIMQQSGPDGSSFYKGTFTVDNDSGEVEISSDFTEVREERDFVEMQEQGSTKNETTQTEEEEEDMSNISKETFVSTLIGCDRSHFTEDHREFLMGLEESALEKLGPANPTEGNEAEEDAKDQTGAASEVVTVEKGSEGEAAKEAPDEGKEEEQGGTEPTALEAFVSEAPEEFRTILQDAVKANEEKKEGLVKSILEAVGNKFTEEQLQGKDIDELESLESLAGGKGEEAPTDNVNIGTPMGRVLDFSGRPAVNVAGNENEESPPMGRSTIADQVSKSN